MHVRESSGFRVQVLKKNQEMDGKLIETSFLCRFYSLGFGRRKKKINPLEPQGRRVRSLGRDGKCSYYLPVFSLPYP
jgi:hypothetical protein